MITFKVRFCLGGVLTLLSGGLAQIRVIDTIDQGQSCFGIFTPSAQYYYHKEGCGFSSIVDIEGNDWVSYQPGGGAAGEYRGIPNLGWQFHPGYTKGGRTTLVVNTANRVTLLSEANGWEGTWDFYATHAVFTLTKRQESYWFLYEGTPGGRMEPSRDYYYVPDRTLPSGVRRALASEDRTADLSPEWIAFGDPSVKRMLVLVHREDDNLRDDYYAMGGEGGMTVFGFGRNNSQDPCWYCMTSLPNVFAIAFIEDTIGSNVREFATRLIAGTVGLRDAITPAVSLNCGSYQHHEMLLQAFDILGRWRNGSALVPQATTVPYTDGKNVLTVFPLR